MEPLSSGRFVTWPEKGVRAAGRAGRMIWWSVGLRADSCRSRGKTAFTGRGFADSESELIKSSVELPGTPVWLLSALSPVRFGNMSRLLPARFRLFPHHLRQSPLPITGGLDWREASPSILSCPLLIRLPARLRRRGPAYKQNQDHNRNKIRQHGQNL